MNGQNMELESSKIPKIAVFYHCYLPNEQDISLFTEQLERLKSSGLYDAANIIFSNISTRSPLIFSALDRYRKVKFDLHSEPFLSECETFEFLRYSASKKSDDWCFLYFHTKGSTKKCLNTTLWRKYMEHFCIDHWDTCVNLINEDGYDVVGVDFLRYPKPHFSGNFWWANKTTILQTQEIDKKDRARRLIWEFWLLSNFKKQPISIVCLHQSNTNLYHVPFTEEQYKNKIEPCHITLT